MSLRASAHTGVAISSRKVAALAAPVNIESLEFTMLSTILPYHSASQEIPTAATQPRNDTKFCEFCAAGVVLRAANQDSNDCRGQSYINYKLPPLHSLTELPVKRKFAHSRNDTERRRAVTKTSAPCTNRQRTPSARQTEI